jgi:hypothetical protein
MAGRAALTCLAAALCALVTATGAAAQMPPQNIYTGVATPSDTSARGVGYFQGGPTGIPAVCWFEYGPTTAYGGRAEAVCAGTSYADLGPLTPGTLYHYRAAASNDAGTTYAADKTFTTLGSPPPGPPPPPNAEPPTAGIAVLRNQSPASAARRGLRLQLTLLGSCPCTVRGEVRFRGRLAGKRRRSNAQGTVALTVRLKASARSRLKIARRATLAVRLHLTDSAGRSRVRNKTVRLRRR